VVRHWLARFGESDELGEESRLMMGCNPIIRMLR
jgi:hypothetical protein